MMVNETDDVMMMEQGKKSCLIHGPIEKTLVLPSETSSEKESNREGKRKTTIQLSVHRPPSKHFSKQLEKIFPENNRITDILIIPTFQMSENDLISSNPIVNKERDDLLENFYHLAKGLYERHKELGHWFDATDPTSGYPLFGKETSVATSAIYPDVDGCERLLRYPSVQVGCCRVLLHPKWGSKNYPGTLFSTAPLNILLEIMEDYLDSHKL